MGGDFGSDLLLEGIKTVFSLILLVVGWLGGQSIVAYWDYRKKRNEIDIANAQRFFELYGEFKAIIRLWRVFHINTHPEDNPPADTNFIDIPERDATRWELLKRAAAAESGVESLILKLTAERIMSAEEMKSLGLFRQAYQRLRESIREDKSLHWTYKSREYVLFNELATTFARLLAVDKAPKLEMLALDAGPEHPDSDAARANLEIVTSYRSQDFEEQLKEVRPPKKHAKLGAGAGSGDG